MRFNTIHSFSRVTNTSWSLNSPSTQVSLVVLNKNKENLIRTAMHLWLLLLLGCIIFMGMCSSPSTTQEDAESTMESEEIDASLNETDDTYLPDTASNSPVLHEPETPETGLGLSSASSNDAGEDAYYFIQEVETRFSEDWDQWEIETTQGAGSLSTYMSNDWDKWEVEIPGFEGYMETYMSEDWDHWELGTIDIETRFSEDMDSWEVEGQTGSLRIETRFSEDWDSWEIQGPKGKIIVKTNMSEDWDHWEIDDTMAEELPVVKMAAIFVCIFSALYSMEIIPPRD